MARFFVAAAIVAGVIAMGAPTARSEGAPPPIAAFSGAGLENTRPFTTTGPWEVTWKSSDNVFQLYLYSADGNLIEMLANQGSGPGSSYYPKAGTYYLQVNTGAPWSLTITPYR